MRLRRLALLGIISLPILVTFLGEAGAQASCKDSRRIVGGEDADIKEHPWQVAINIDGAFCGGSIIAHNWVLTAAHCFLDSKQSGDVRVKTGIGNVKVGAWASIDGIVTHAGYNPKTQENDLALVKLKVRPVGDVIPLASPDQQIRPCEELEVTGWGRTTEKGTTSNKLQKARVPYVDNATCNRPNAYNGKIRAGMMCAGLREGGIDSCQGDSGGPLVMKGPDGPVLVGVVSWGEGCARKLKYGVYTRLGPYRDWITKVITSAN